MPECDSANGRENIHDWPSWFGHILPTQTCSNKDRPEPSYHTEGHRKCYPTESDSRDQWRTLSLEGLDQNAKAGTGQDQETPGLPVGKRVWCCESHFCILIESSIPTSVPSQFQGAWLRFRRCNLASRQINNGKRVYEKYAKYTSGASHSAGRTLSSLWGGQPCQELAHIIHADIQSRFGLPRLRSTRPGCMSCRVQIIRFAF